MDRYSARRSFRLSATLATFLLLFGGLAVATTTTAPGSSLTAATPPPLMKNGYRQPLSSMLPLAGYMANDCGYHAWGDYLAGQYHIGADFDGNANAPVYAIDDGHVVQVGNFGDGKALFVRHRAGDGTFFTVLYGHINTSLGANDDVNAGQQVGTLYAFTTNGPHLHLGLLTDSPIPSSGWGTLSCPSWPDKNGFEYNPPLFLNEHPAKNWAGDIVQWDNATGPNTSWIVKIDTSDNVAKRYWIENASVFDCMTNIGYVDRGAQPASVLDSLPDVTGNPASCPIQAPSGSGDRLLDGQGLYLGQSLSSPNGDYALTMRDTGAGTGVLVLTGPTGNIVWTTGRYIGNYVKLYADCQFVGRDLWGSAHWAADSQVTASGCKAVLKDTGSLVIYRVSDNKAIWSSQGGRLV